MANRYYWIRLKEDFFDSIRIKKLRKLAGGDTYTIIYLKMQLRAMKTDGVLKYQGVEPTFAEELALDIDEDVDNVSVTLQFLEKCGMIEGFTESEYFLPEACENSGSEGSSAERMRNLRARKASLCDAGVTRMLQVGDVEIEKNKRKRRKDKNIYSQAGARHRPEVKEIIEYLNEKTGKHYKSEGYQNRRGINARLDEGFTVDDFRRVIDIKTAEWMGTDMEQYLRPQTLFGTKFESYLNQRPRGLGAVKDWLGKEGA